MSGGGSSGVGPPEGTSVPLGSGFQEGPALYSGPNAVGKVFLPSWQVGSELG